jgi:hypothetical protein
MSVGMTANTLRLRNFEFLIQRTRCSAIGYIQLSAAIVRFGKVDRSRSWLRIATAPARLRQSRNRAGNRKNQGPEIQQTGRR